MSQRNPLVGQRNPKTTQTKKRWQVLSKKTQQCAAASRRSGKLPELTLQPYQVHSVNSAKNSGPRGMALHFSNLWGPAWMAGRHWAIGGIPERFAKPKPNSKSAARRNRPQSRKCRNWRSCLGGNREAIAARRFDGTGRDRCHSFGPPAIRRDA